MHLTAWKHEVPRFVQDDNFRNEHDGHVLS